MENPSSRTRKRPPKPAPSAALRLTAGKKKGAEVRVTFGDVTVYGPAPDPEQVKRNVELTQQALGRLGAVLEKPGVVIDEEKDVPLFWIDDTDIHKFKRKLNGKIETGVLENGAFKVIE